MDDDEAEALAEKSRDDALAALWFSWDQAYEIGIDADGQWRARRRDGLGERMAADDPDDLRRQIRADYEFKPVERADPPADAAGVCGVGQVAAEMRLRRQQPGARMELREVRLAFGADLEAVYAPTGRVLAGVREEDGTVTWS
jgi:hypothetical protein